MQLAILLVLIVIALILAPGLLWLVAIAVAAYGAFFVAAIIVAVVAVPLIFIFLWLIPRSKTASERLTDKNIEFNKRYLEEASQTKEREKQLEVALCADELEPQFEAAADSGISKSTPSPDEIMCSRCSTAFAKAHLVCPHCGKSPLPSQR